MDYAGGDGVDVLEHGGILYAVQVRRRDGVRVARPQAAREVLGVVYVVAAYRQVRRARQRHLLGVARAGHHQHVVARYVELADHVVRDELVLVGHYALHGRHHGFLADVHGHLAHVVLEVGRRGGYQQGVGVGADLVDVRGEEYAVHVELHVGQIRRVVAQAHKLLNAVVAAHVPVYAVLGLQQQFGQRCGPAAAAQYRYFAWKAHGME